MIEKVLASYSLWVRDNAELSLEQKVLLDKFIETKYQETNYCLK